MYLSRLACTPFLHVEWFSNPPCPRRATALLVWRHCVNKLENELHQLYTHSLTSTLSWVSLRQPASEKCFYFSTEKFQLSKQNDKKLYPAHESRGRNGPTKWCRWMATFLRRLNASDFPSSGVRCAGVSSARHRLQKTRCCLKSEKREFLWT